MYRDDDPHPDNVERVLRFQPGTHDVQTDDAIEVYHRVGEAVICEDTVRLKHGGTWNDDYDEIEEEKLENIDEVLTSSQNRADMASFIKRDNEMNLNFGRTQEATLFEVMDRRVLIFSRI